MFNPCLDKNTILINGKFYAQNITGVQRFAREIILEMDKQLKDQNYRNDFAILIPSDSKNIPNLKNIKLIKTRFRASHFWEQLYLPIVSRNYELLNLAGSAPLVKFGQFITMHDAAVFEANSAYKKIFVIWYRILFTIQAHWAKKIFTVSKFSAERLSKILPVLEKKIYIIYNGHEHILRINSKDEYLSKYNLKNKNFYFTIGSFNPNKNLKIIIDVARSLEDDNILFVISGGVYSGSFSQKSDICQPPKNIRFVESIDDNELKALYLNAKCLIFPSKYEGFGIPIIEALALKVDVISSDIPPAKEIGADLISYFEYNNLFQLRQLIINRESEAKSNYNYEQAKELLARFSWVKSAALLLTILTKKL